MTAPVSETVHVTGYTIFTQGPISFDLDPNTSIEKLFGLFVDKIKTPYHVAIYSSEMRGVHTLHPGRSVALKLHEGLQVDSPEESVKMLSRRVADWAPHNSFTYVIYEGLQHRPRIFSEK